MRCLTPSLLRRFCGLLPQYLSAGPSQSPNLSPKQSSLRQSCSARPGLLTAPDVVSYWQKVFEKNGIPEARESSEYIVSFVLGAKTFQSLDSEKLRAPLTAVQQEQIQQLSCKRLERMPVQYVLGEWDFQNLTLKMRPPVFIPRPETEIKTMMHAGRNGTCYSSADSTVISGQALETELLFPFKGDPQEMDGSSEPLRRVSWKYFRVARNEQHLRAIQCPSRMAPLWSWNHQHLLWLQSLPVLISELFSN